MHRERSRDPVPASGFSDCGRSWLPRAPQDADRLDLHVILMLHSPGALGVEVPQVQLRAGQ